MFPVVIRKFVRILRANSPSITDSMLLIADMGNAKRLSKNALSVDCRFIDPSAWLSNFTLNLAARES